MSRLREYFPNLPKSYLPSLVIFVGFIGFFASLGSSDLGLEVLARAMFWMFVMAAAWRWAELLEMTPSAPDEDTLQDEVKVGLDQIERHLRGER